MRLERGAHERGIRVSVILQSEDVIAHGAMTDNPELFKALADALSEEVRRVLQDHFPPVEIPLKRNA